jgi:hypothetical protein
VHTLIATSDLVRAPGLRKHADIDVLYISSGNRNGNDVFGLTRGGAGMTADAASVVDYLCPLDRRVGHRANYSIADFQLPIAKFRLSKQAD